MSANESQVGGDHYKGSYQHWDLMLDLKAQCPIVYATKYVYRWRKKNGFQDLRKALHCVEKAIEVELPATCASANDFNKLDHFLQSNEVDIDDGFILRLIVSGLYDAAYRAIQTMLWLEEAKTAEPTPAYVNQGAE